MQTKTHHLFSTKMVALIGLSLLLTLVIGATNEPAAGRALVDWP